MSTRRYRWAGASSDDLNNIIEAGSGSTLDFLQRTPWVEATVVDATRDTDLDDFMAQQGYVVDTTGPTLVVTAGPYGVGTEQTVLVDATAGPITVTMPLASSRLGNDITVQKIDGSANSVTVTRTGADTIGGAISQVLDMAGDGFLLVADPVNSEWQISQSRRATDITFDSSGLPTITADNVQDAISDILTDDLGSIEVFTSGEALTVGDLLTLNSAGAVIRADSSIGTANYEVIGVSKETVGIGVPVQVFTHTGVVPPVRFTAAPAAALNGRLVFLSTSTGLASIAPPGGGGNAIFTIGTLQGADGISTSPTVVFRPQLIALRS
jgi:hypothetical protein